MIKIIIWKEYLGSILVNFLFSILGKETFHWGEGGLRDSQEVRDSFYKNEILRGQFSHLKKHTKPFVLCVICKYW